MNVPGRFIATVLVAISCHAVAQTTAKPGPARAERSTGEDNPYLAYAAAVWDLAKIEACANDWGKGGDLAGSLELRRIRQQLAADRDVRIVTSGFRPWLLGHYGTHRIMEPAEGTSETIRRIGDASAVDIDRAATQNHDGMERDCERIRSNAIEGRSPMAPVRSRFPAGIADLEAARPGNQHEQAGDDRMPPDAELDALWMQSRWNDLGDILTNQRSPDARRPAVKWLSTRLQAGGGLMHGLILAKMLWEGGNRMSEHDGVREPVGDTQDELNAAIILLYTRAMIEIDGLRCADATAADTWLARLDGNVKNASPQLVPRNVSWPIYYLRRQPEAVRIAAVDAALAMERRTASLRRDDDLLCRAGKDGEMAAARRDERPWVPTTQRHYDGTVGLEPPADWVPGFLTPEKYRPLQDKAKAGLRDRLLALATPPRQIGPLPIIDGFGRTYMLFFAEDSDELSARGREVVKEAAKLVQLLPMHKTKVLVHGYTDSHLDADRSMELSHRRARNVGRELVRNGLAPDIIWIEWFGKTHLLVPTGDGVSELQNNRVEIIP